MSDLAADHYVEISRYLYDVADPTVPDLATQRLVDAVRPDGGLTLDKLLEDSRMDPLVLVSPSGSGKTTEFRQLARRLRAAGRAAAFADACGVVQHNEMDLELEEWNAFQDMLAQEGPGIFLVDALDELGLRQRNHEELFRRLEREIAFSNHRIRLVFSTRSGGWGPADVRDLRRFLARVGASRERFVAFWPLDLPAIRALASAWGVANVDAFARQLEEEEIHQLIEMRPTDVRLFAHLWRGEESLKRWTDVLQRYVDASFVEEEGHRSRGQRLPIEVGRRGLERVAAATMLMQLPHVSTSRVAVLDGAISSRRLFVDWPTAELTELFENPLFAHKGRGAEAVQLPQGPLSHFLAARWLAERHRLGLAAEDLRAHVLTRVPGEKRYEVPLDRRKVVGWLASEVPKFRDLIVADHPALVLYDGDPDRLADSEIRVALRFLCLALTRGEATGSATRATVKRVARPELEPDVRELLEQYGTAPAVLIRILPLVEHGRYRSCSMLALGLARSSPDALVRSFAIDAFGAAAPEERSQLLPLAATEHADIPRGSLLRTLAPDILKDGPLVSFLRCGGDWVRMELRKVADKITTTDLDAVIVDRLPVLTRSTVDAATEAAFDVVVPVALARLRRSGANDPTLVRALCAIESLRDHHVGMLSDTDERALNALLAQNQELRRAIWAQRFQNATTSTRGFEHLMHPQFGDVQIEDMEWLWGMAAQHQDPATVGHPSLVLEWLWGRLPVEERERILRDISVPELRLRLESLSESHRQAAAMRQAATDEQERRDTQVRRRNEDVIAQRRAEIESGDELGALVWAWDHLEGIRGDDDRLNIEGLRRYVGDDYVETFLRGLRACWRRIDVPVPAPGAERMIRDLVGLTGVSLAVRDGLDLSVLSRDEARRAARFGLYGANAFPFWYGDLTRLFQDDVRGALHEVLSLEWNHSAPVHGVLRFTVRSDRELTELMRSLVLDLLEAGPPMNPQTIDDAVDTILTSMTELPRVLALIHREIRRGAPGIPDPNWLRLWAHLEPVACADWLGECLESDRDVAMPVFLTVAASLEMDLGEFLGHSIRATNLMSPRALARWARLLLLIVKPKDDLVHHGVYSPGERDHAQSLRHRFLSRLAASPTPEARLLLQQMRADPSLASERRIIDGLLQSQHEVAVEASVTRWTEEDVLGIERRDEKQPQTLQELFELVNAHLRHVHQLVADDDFSYRDLFKERGGEKIQERDIQLWVASCLRQRARGLYSVVRENVVDLNKEVDISAFAPGIGHVPIEIKPLGDYSANALEVIMEQQLIGQYMQPPNRQYGILLLVRRDDRTWKLNGKSVGVERLVVHVQERARQLGIRHGKDISIAVIDLLALPVGIRARGKESRQKAPPRKETARRSAVKVKGRKRGGRD